MKRVSQGDFKDGLLCSSGCLVCRSMRSCVWDMMDFFNYLLQILYHWGITCYWTGLRVLDSFFAFVQLCMVSIKLVLLTFQQLLLVQKLAGGEVRSSQISSCRINICRRMSWAAWRASVFFSSFSLPLLWNISDHFKTS